MTPETEKIVSQMINEAINKSVDFSTRKLGDTPTDNNQLTPKGYVDSAIASIATITDTMSGKGGIFVGSAASVVGVLPVGTDGKVLTASSVQSLGVTWADPIVGLFGDASDGVGNADGTSNLNTLAPVSRLYTLDRDYYFSSLGVGQASILTNGYRIFVQGTTTLNAGAVIYRNGVNGSAGFATSGGGGAGGLGGGGGSVLAAGTLPGALGGATGSTGGQGTSGDTNGFSGVAGSNGSDANPSIGITGLAGAAGGGGGNAGVRSGGSGGTAGSAGTATLAKNNPHTLNGAYIHADLVQSYTPHLASAQNGASSGGGGGAVTAGGTSGAGGGGGGGGGNGGVVALYSRYIVNSATAGISAVGGNGGDGGAGENAGVAIAGGGGGGAGGRGGNGGVIILVYQGITQNGTFTVAGGTGGSGGSGGSRAGSAVQADNGTAGNSGGSGNAGIIWQFQVK